MRDFDYVKTEEDSAVLDRLTNRYKITVEFILDSDSIDDAEVEIKELIDYGIIATQAENDTNKIYDYDVIDSEPAEVQ